MYKNETELLLKKLAQTRWNLSLDNITTLMGLLGNPHQDLRCIHVAGTNGKGSTCAMLASILQAAGYKTGLYTSPHLVNVEERIQINGQPISKSTFEQRLLNLRPAFEKAHSTYFEALTALAFQYFVDSEIEVAIIETGLGGRLDATNIIDPTLSIITEIALDHEIYLGTSLAEITREKAGIIKKKVPCLAILENPKVENILQATCDEHGAALYKLDECCKVLTRTYFEEKTILSLTALSKHFDELTINLAGSVQVKNASLAVTAALLLAEAGFEVPDAKIYEGLQKVRWPGRMHLFSKKPKILLDVCHNAAAVSAFMRDVRIIFKYERLFVVIGLLQDKDHRQIGTVLSKFAEKIFVVTPDTERGLSGEVLKAHISQEMTNVEYLSDFLSNLNDQVLPIVGERDLLCIIGSHYVVGPFLNYYLNSGKKS